MESPDADGLSFEVIDLEVGWGGLPRALKTKERLQLRETVVLVERNAPDLEAELSHAGQHFLTIDHESYIGAAAKTIDRRSPYTALEQIERLTGRRAAGCEGIIANERGGIPARARALWGTARPLPERPRLEWQGAFGDSWPPRRDARDGCSEPEPQPYEFKPDWDRAKTACDVASGSSRYQGVRQRLWALRDHDFALARETLASNPYASAPPDVARDEIVAAIGGAVRLVRLWTGRETHKGREAIDARDLILALAPLELPPAPGRRDLRMAGARVRHAEIVEDHAGDTYRAIYTVKLADVVYVLRAFQKKARRGIATPKCEIELIEARLAVAERHHRERRQERGRS